MLYYKVPIVEGQVDCSAGSVLCCAYPQGSYMVCKFESVASVGAEWVEITAEEFERDFPADEFPDGSELSYATSTMLASSWSGNLYSFEKEYPNNEYDLSIEVAPTATVEQFEAFGEAMICGSHDSNVATAIGDVPTVDIPIIIKAVRK